MKIIDAIKTIKNKDTSEYILEHFTYEPERNRMIKIIGEFALWINYTDGSWYIFTTGTDVEIGPFIRASNGARLRSILSYTQSILTMVKAMIEANIK